MRCLQALLIIFLPRIPTIQAHKSINHPPPLLRDLQWELEQRQQFLDLNHSTITSHTIPSTCPSPSKKSKPKTPVLSPHPPTSPSPVRPSLLLIKPQQTPPHPVSSTPLSIDRYANGWIGHERVVMRSRGEREKGTRIRRIPKELQARMTAQMERFALWLGVLALVFLVEG